MKLLKENGEIVVAALEVADSYWSRLRGRQFRAPLLAGGGLLLVPCPSVHTCFVRGALDIVMLDRTGRVIAVRPAVRPWRVVASVRGCYAILELPAGTATVSPGDVLHLEAATTVVRPSLTFLARTE